MALVASYEIHILPLERSFWQRYTFYLLWFCVLYYDITIYYTYLWYYYNDRQVMKLQFCLPLWLLLRLWQTYFSIIVLTIINEHLLQGSPKTNTIVCQLPDKRNIIICHGTMLCIQSLTSNIKELIKKKKNTLKMIFKNAILLYVSLWPEYTQHQI